MKLGLAVFKFLVLGALFLVSNYNLHLNVSSERAQFYGLFYGWMNNLYGHSLRIVGYVVNSEWLPKTSSSVSGAGG